MGCHLQAPRVVLAGATRAWCDCPSTLWQETTGKTARKQPENVGVAVTTFKTVLARQKSIKTTSRGCSFVCWTLLEDMLG